MTGLSDVSLTLAKGQGPESEESINDWAQKFLFKEFLWDNCAFGCAQSMSETCGSARVSVSTCLCCAPHTDAGWDVCG